MAVPFLRLRKWSQGALTSADELRAIALAKCDVTPRQWRDRFAAAAMRSGVVASPRSSRTGALSDSDASTFNMWSESDGCAVPWKDWRARTAAFGMTPLSLLGTSVMVSSRVELYHTASSTKGFGLRAGPEGLSAGMCIAQLPLCCAVTLFDESKGSTISSLPEKTLLRRSELCELVQHVIDASRVAAPAATLDAEYRRAVAVTIMDRAREPTEAPNLILASEPTDVHQRERLRELLRDLHFHLVRPEDEAVTQPLDESARLQRWSDIVAATAACMSRTNALPSPFHSGLLPFLHNVNHRCKPNAVAITGALSGETGTIEASPEVQLDRALVLSAAANELGVDGVDAAEWAAVVAMPAVELIAIEDVAPHEEVCITYHYGGDDDTEDDIKATFLDNHGFVPELLNPHEVKRIITESHGAARRWREARKSAVAKS